MTLRLAKTIAASVLLASLAYAQASSNPSSAEVVSSSNATTNADARKAPSITSVEGELVKPNSAKLAIDDEAIVADPASLLPDLPMLPHAKATLVGGTIERLDRVRDRITVQVFGGGRVSALYDPRTHIYMGSKEVTLADLKQGERVYLDTILDGSAVFARAIRVSASVATGESQGIVLGYRADRGELTLRDGLSPKSVHVRVSPSTKFVQNGQEAPANALVPGALVAVSFGSEGNGGGLAREISILAQPGSHYVFSGQVAHMDLRRGLLVLNSSTDRKTYEIYLDLSSAPDDNLHAGAMVTVDANFEDSRYVARNVTINSQGK